MNRLEELEALQRELEEIPAADCVQKAIRRRRKKRALRRTLGSLAAVFCLFVGTINLSPTVSAACREIPFLAELTELLIFNPSLQMAAENDFVQLVGQEQTKGDITARIEYLIVDQKQLNIYYRLSSDRYPALSSTPKVALPDGTHFPCSLSYGGLYDEDGALRDMTVDSSEQDLPSSLMLTLRVYSNDVTADAPAPAEPEILEEFTFLLEFDPQFTEKGRQVPLNRQIQLNGQTFTVTDMEIYPTHIRINIDEAADNTAWLNSLHFYLETGDGRKAEKISNGITATGSTTTPSMTGYRAESTYFYEADAIRMVIEGADFLDKAREEFHVNLKTLACDPLPEGVRLEAARRVGDGWELDVRIREDAFRHVQVFRNLYRDAAGTEYEINRYATYVSDYEQEAPWTGWTKQTYYLDGFSGDEAWLQLFYTDFWAPATPVTVELQG